MAQSRDIQIALDRGVQFVFGGAAGLALWALTSNWDNPSLPPALYLALLVFLAVQSGTTLALSGPLRMGPALAGALVLAVPVTGLASVAGWRHVRATDALDNPVMLAILAVLVFFSIPFLLVRLRRPSDWLQYDALFQAAWTVTVRFVTAWTFVAVFWLVAVLSGTLLGLVGIDWADTVLSISWVRFVLTGALLGMGLTVAYELRATVSPYLILRLLRLLVPVVLAVVAVFLAAVPFRGLSRLFGDFDAAGPLMGAAMLAITLISTALDRGPVEEVKTPGLRLATQVLALLLPLLSGLAVWAVVIRVGQYGWTPDRVLAAGIAVFLLAYGFGYCAAVAMRHNWTGRIRGVNVAMAIAVIAASALWLTPVLDAARISTASQINRYETGRAAPDDLPLWKMSNDWGRVGQAGLERLAAMAARNGDAELGDLVALVKDQTDPFRYEQAIRQRQAPRDAADLARLLAVRPDGADGPGAAAYAALPEINRESWLAGCRRPLPDGRPGCVLVLGDFAPVSDARAQGIVLYLDRSGQARGNHVLVRANGDMAVRVIFDPVADTWPTLPGKTIAQALDGAFTIAPSGDKALRIGNAVLVPSY